MKRYLKIGLTSLVLISLSNIAHSITKEECLRVVNEGNVLSSEFRFQGEWHLIIAHDIYFYSVLLHHEVSGISVNCITRRHQTVRE